MISLGSHGHISLEKNPKLLTSLKCFILNTTTKNAKEIGYFTWKKSVFKIFKTDVYLSDLEKS